MKKKLLALLMSALMLAAFSASVFAAPVDEDVDGKGYIGPDDPSTIGDMIDISFPSEFEWAVTDVSAPAVTAVKYQIVNNSAKAELSVTLKSFLMTSSETITGLTLHLTDDLAQSSPTVIGQNIMVDTTGFTGGTTPYANTMAPSATWEYSFSGTYTGAIPAVAIQPTYTMVLEFDVVSILP